MSIRLTPEPCLCNLLNSLRPWRFQDEENASDEWKKDKELCKSLWIKDLRKWLDWPPDIFAVTSLVLGNFDLYRLAATTRGGRQIWPEPDWNRRVEDLARAWRAWCVEKEDRKDWPGRQNASTSEGNQADHEEERSQKPQTSGRNFFESSIATLADWLTTEVMGEGSLSKLTMEGHDEHWNITKTLLELHAVADRACRGVGVQSTPSANLEDPQERHRVGDRQGRFFFLANLLLTSTGSLSRIYRHHGIVVPKMRTPQLGMTLRSLSHHLTFHRTEVNIDWRAVPWANRDEDTLNVMIVPYPWTMSAKDFRPAVHAGTAGDIGPARYFEYAPDRSRNNQAESFDELPVDQAVIQLLEEAKKEIQRIHVVILPEMSLSATEYLNLQARLLEKKSKGEHLPILIAGVRDDPTGSDNKSSGDGTGDLSGKVSRENESIENALGENRMRLSACYADKWYEMDQHKHHRWCLDTSQIRQYRLGSSLPAEKTWWEAIRLHPRRLSFFAPNSWLTLCPLICEDLARLEPVSELIRGVGPTLLIALLQDGPQLRERWSGRYASIFADDPGSSVLSLTSLAMATRSRAISALSRKQEDEEIEKKSRTIALWKDQDTGWREIRFDEKDRAAILTLTAKHLKEFTADGRYDDQYASSLVLQRVEMIKGPADEESGSKSEVGEAQDKVEETQEKILKGEEKRLFWGDKIDIAELTLFTFFTNSVVHAGLSSFRELITWTTLKNLSSEIPADSSTPTPAEPSGPERPSEISTYPKYIDPPAYVVHRSYQTLDETAADNGSKKAFRTIQYRFAVYSVGLMSFCIIVASRAKGCQNENELSRAESAIELLETLLGIFQKSMDLAGISDELVETLQQQADSDLAQDDHSQAAHRLLKDHWSALVDGSSKGDGVQAGTEVEKYSDIEGIERARILQSTILSVAWAFHNRLCYHRQRSTLRHEGAGLIAKLESILERAQSIDIFSSYLKTAEGTQLKANEKVQPPDSETSDSP